MTLSCADDIPGARSDALFFVMLLVLSCSCFYDAPGFVMLQMICLGLAVVSFALALAQVLSLFGSDDDVDF